MIAVEQEAGVFPLAVLCLLSENSRQGHRLPTSALHRGFDPVISNTATSFGPLAYDFRIGPRSTGKERDSETGLDYFGFRYMSSAQGRWTTPDLVNVTEDRRQAPSSTLNKYVYAANNPLKFVDPDGRDITYFYDQGGIAGHAVLFAYNPKNGDSAVESFGPKVHSPVWAGKSMFEMDTFGSEDDLRKQFASLTIDTTPELAQEVINYIRSHPDPSVWSFTGPDCSSEVWKILKKFKLGGQTDLMTFSGVLPSLLWSQLIYTYNPAYAGEKPASGSEYGKYQFSSNPTKSFDLLWLSLQQWNSTKESVTTKLCDADGKNCR